MPLSKLQLPTVNCAWTVWNAWDTCTKSCDGGTQQRTRVIGAPPKYGGTNCTGNATETGPCNTHNCPGNSSMSFDLTSFGTEHNVMIKIDYFLVDCTWNVWGSWGSCTKTCGSGSMTRTRSKNGPFYGGIDCSGSLSESTSCNTNSCPGIYYF